MMKYKKTNNKALKMYYYLSIIDTILSCAYLL
jgi:hypothetical protein